MLWLAWYFRKHVSAPRRGPIAVLLYKHTTDEVGRLMIKSVATVQLLATARLLRHESAAPWSKLGESWSTLHCLMW